MGAATGVLAEGLRDLARLVLPVQCPGCDRWDELLCESCASALAGPVHRCEGQVPRLDRVDGHPPLPVWAAAPYAGVVRDVVVAWKEQGRLDLTTPLVATAVRIGTQVAPWVGRVVGDHEVRLVPVPSAPGAHRRRGADLVGALAAGVARGLRDGGLLAPVVPLLRRRHGVRDQVGLGARARGRNTAGSVRVRAGRARRARPVGAWHLLVDDVVTTGSTLAACADELSGLGGLVLGGVVLAATPGPSRDPGPLLPAPSGH